MIEFIIGATAGIYVYKKVKLVRNLVDTSVQKIKNNYFKARYKIVDFGAGKYAVRRFDLFTYEFLDIRDYPKRVYWWSGTEFVEKYCFADLESCEIAYKKLKASKSPKRYGIPVK